ncbi:hypothetical protein RQP46_005771 [Phenoliferia psychrophenolica]
MGGPQSKVDGTFMAPTKTDIFSEADLVARIVAQPCTCPRAADPTSLCARRQFAATSTGLILETKDVLTTHVFFLDCEIGGIAAECKRLQRIEIGDLGRPGPWDEAKQQHVPIAEVNPMLFCIPEGHRVLATPLAHPAHYTTHAAHMTLRFAQSWPSSDPQHAIASELAEFIVDWRAYIHSKQWPVPDGAGGTKLVHFLALQLLAVPDGNDQSKYSATIGLNKKKAYHITPPKSAFSVNGLDVVQTLFATASKHVNELIGEMVRRVGALMLLENEVLALLIQRFIYGTLTGGHDENDLSCGLQINNTPISSGVKTSDTPQSANDAEILLAKNLSSRFKMPHGDPDAYGTMTVAIDGSCGPRGMSGGSMQVLGAGLAFTPDPQNPSLMAFHGTELHSGTGVTVPPPSSLRRIVHEDLTLAGATDPTQLAHLASPEAFQAYLDDELEIIRALFIPYKQECAQWQDPPLQALPRQSLATHTILGSGVNNYTPFLSEGEGLAAYGSDNNATVLLVTAAARDEAWSTLENLFAVMQSAKKPSDPAVTWSEVFTKAETDGWLDYRESLRKFAAIRGLTLPVLAAFPWCPFRPDDPTATQDRHLLQDTDSNNVAVGRPSQAWDDAPARFLKMRGWINSTKSLYFPIEPFPANIPLVTFDLPYIQTKEWYRTLPKNDALRVFIRSCAALGRNPVSMLEWYNDLIRNNKGLLAALASLNAINGYDSDLSELEESENEPPSEGEDDNDDGFDAGDDEEPYMGSDDDLPDDGHSTDGMDIDDEGSASPAPSSDPGDENAADADEDADFGHEDDDNLRLGTTLGHELAETLGHAEISRVAKEYSKVLNVLPSSIDLAFLSEPPRHPYDVDPGDLVFKDDIVLLPSVEDLGDVGSRVGETGTTMSELFVATQFARAFFYEGLAELHHRHELLAEQATFTAIDILTAQRNGLLSDHAFYNLVVEHSMKGGRDEATKFRKSDVAAVALVPAPESNYGFITLHPHGNPLTLTRAQPSRSSPHARAIAETLCDLVLATYVYPSLPHFQPFSATPLPLRTWLETFGDYTRRAAQVHDAFGTTGLLVPAVCDFIDRPASFLKTFKGQQLSIAGHRALPIALLAQKNIPATVTALVNLGAEFDRLLPPDFTTTHSPRSRSFTLPRLLLGAAAAATVADITIPASIIRKSAKRKSFLLLFSTDYVTDLSKMPPSLASSSKSIGLRRTKLASMAIPAHEQAKIIWNLCILRILIPGCCAAVMGEIPAGGFSVPTSASDGIATFKLWHAATKAKHPTGVFSSTEAYGAPCQWLGIKKNNIDSFFDSNFIAIPALLALSVEGSPWDLANLLPSRFNALTAEEGTRLVAGPLSEFGAARGLNRLGGVKFMDLQSAIDGGWDSGGYDPDFVEYVNSFSKDDIRLPSGTEHWLCKISRKDWIWWRQMRFYMDVPDVFNEAADVWGN